MPPVTKEEIRERLQTVNVFITPAATPFFAAVSERKMRYVVSITLFGDGVSTRELSNITKLEEDGVTYTPKYSKISIAPPEKIQLPIEGRDLENPIITLEGGTRLYGQLTAGVTIAATCEYWDNDI